MLKLLSKLFVYLECNKEDFEKLWWSWQALFFWFSRCSIYSRNGK